MSLNLNKRFFDSIRFKMVLSIVVTIFLSVITVCGIIYLISAKTLRKEDKKIIRAKATAIAKLYPASGDRKDEDQYFIAVLKPDGTPVSVHLPDDMDKEELNWVVKSSGQNLKEGWRVILLEAGEEEVDYDTKIQEYLLSKKLRQLVYLLEQDIFESYTKKLPDQNWLVVGKSAEVREKFLRKIRSTALMVFAPFLLLSFVLAWLLGGKLLSPVKSMILAIDRIQGGDKTARVPLRDTEDELDQLAARFNALMDHNTKLISNLTTTLDNVAHDLRTPLTRILNASEEGIHRKISSEELKDVLSKNMENAQIIKNLLDAIFDLTEAETGTMKLKKEEIDVSELLDRTADLYQYVAEDKNIQIKVVHDESAVIFGDQVRISQALTNLVDNAIKYSSKGDVITLSSSMSKYKGVSITVQDTGVGIPKDELPKIWDRMYRVDSSRSTPGLGIGLSVVKAIVESHGGQVRVESESGKGSVFSMIFPFRNAR